MDGTHINYMNYDKTKNIIYEENQKEKTQHQNGEGNKNKTAKEYIIWKEKRSTPKKIKNNIPNINKEDLRMDMKVTNFKKESLEKIEPIGYIELAKKKSEKISEKKSNKKIFPNQSYNDINYNDKKRKQSLLLEENENENIEHYDIMSSSDTILSSDSSLENMYEKNYNHFMHNKNSVDNLDNSPSNSRNKFPSKNGTKKAIKINKSNNGQNIRNFTSIRSKSCGCCNKFLLSSEEKNNSDSTCQKVRFLAGKKMKNRNNCYPDKDHKKCKQIPFVCKFVNCNIKNEEIQINSNTNIIDFNPLTYIANQYMENSYDYVVRNYEGHQKNYTPYSYNMSSELIYDSKNKIYKQANTNSYLLNRFPTKNEKFDCIKNNRMMEYSNNLKNRNIMNRLNIKEKKDMKKKINMIPTRTNDYINNISNSNITTFIKYGPKKYITNLDLYKDTELNNERHDIKNNFQLKNEYKNYLNNLICYIPKHNKNIFYKKKNFKKNKVYKKSLFEDIFKKIKLLSYAIFFCFFISSKNRSIKEQKKKQPL
ncbi:conserved Plasmodium protein, unknown function [Plasmodium vinckei vinckei]|uniref:Uncharacterized protein n=1 Tax=Plasmodium vinckei vinckei TaxID=54757 RepID=A0A449BQ15_PLAVN|nr:conserved Plasmodium protein, unknown function [Plasmodium vinckei vinckei]VEV55469.1 conserved Plasmodium protein, unknown function [Plasmodium vinckei vinckei]